MLRLTGKLITNIGAVLGKRLEIPQASNPTKQTEVEKPKVELQAERYG